MTQPSTHWNAEVYERIGTPMRRWAQAVIDDLHLRGDETILDAGCGSGSVTFDLLERLPSGRIYAVDSSPEMISKMTQAIEERAETRIISIRADLTDFELPEQVDVVFSNAVLHWISDDDALFGCLFRATKPGGHFRAQCGGGDNIARLMAATEAVERREPFAGHLGLAEFRKYRTTEEARAAMERAGWSEVRASLFDAPVRFDNHDEAALYLRTIILQRHVAALTEEHQEPFLRDVIDETIRRFGEPFTADYVRLDLSARRPGAPTCEDPQSYSEHVPEDRTITVPSGPLILEGILHLPSETPAPGIVVCHPHPMYGGDMQSNVVSAICDIAIENGIAALRFNFRGAGASEGEYDNGIGEQEDVRAALAYLQALPEIDAARIALAGYSFGAAVAVRVAASAADLRAFIGVSMPTMMPLQGVKLACPALFVSGDEDEYSDAGEIRAFVRGLGPKAELRLLPGLGHFWFGVEHELKNIVEPFLKAQVLGIPTG